MVERKLLKIIDSCNRALGNYRGGNKFATVGDIHFINENAEELILILTNEIMEDQDKE